MADPQRRLDLRAERRNEWQVYERENEEGGKDAGERAIEVWESGMIRKVVVGRRLGLEEGVDAEIEKEAGAATKSVLEDVSTHKAKTHAATATQASPVPVIRLIIPNSDITSTILPARDAERGGASEGPYNNTLDQQRRQRVRFDEALRMHSYGESQYVGRVVDRDV